MKYINLDQISIGIIFAAISLLILPVEALLAWWVLLPLGILILVIRLYWLGGVLIVVLCLFHWQALNLWQQAERVRELPTKFELTFSIVEILHQQTYQTLIIEAQLFPDYPPQRIYTNWRETKQPKLGEIWHGEIQLRPLSSRLNQGGFDRQKWAFAKGITAQGNVKSAVKVGEYFSWRQQRLNQALQQTAHLEQQGLLLALAFGERAWIDSDSWKIYQQTNTAHLIAISGLHIGLAMGLGVILFKLLQLGLPTHWITPSLPLFFGLLLAGIYSELAGFSIPTFRALVALIIVSLCRLGRLYLTVWQFLVRTVAFLLLCDPFMILSESFWLSIGAVVCLIVWYQVFPLSLIEWRGVPLQYSPLHKIRYLLGLMHLQLGLLWLFTPIQLLIFQGMSLQGFIANFIAVPIFSLVLVPLVLFATFTQGAFQSWQWANDIAVWSTRQIEFFAEHWLYIPQQHSAILIMILVIAFALTCYWVYQLPAKKMSSFSLSWSKTLFPFSLKSERALSLSVQKYVYFFSGSAVIFCLIFLYHTWITRQDWRLEALDVGQGLAILIVKNGRGVLYDTGAAWRGGDMATLEILPYLRRQGIVLDRIIISHDDNDHAGGVNTLLSAYPQATLLQSSLKNYGKTDHSFCLVGEHWQWQGLSFKVLSPKRITERAENGDSCVVVVEDKYHRILLTGDADMVTEQQFVEQVGKIDVLQVGHHGSRTSTSTLLLAKTQPKIALISSGRWNPWRMPHTVVLERLNQQQSAVYNSAILGQTSLIFQGSALKIRTARYKFSPWYRRIIGESPK